MTSPDATGHRVSSVAQTAGLLVSDLASTLIFLILILLTHDIREEDR